MSIRLNHFIMTIQHNQNFMIGTPLQQTEVKLTSESFGRAPTYKTQTNHQHSALSTNADNVAEK